MTKKKITNKKKYTSPKIKKEAVMVFGALCNGTSGPGSGGRKTTAGTPDFCSPSKLLS